jgi:hypothetical protein
MIEASQRIRAAVSDVAALRAFAENQPGLRDATIAIKSFQSRRFVGTYSDLLRSTQYSGASHFFLEELYSDRDYSQRDAQFARVAGVLQRVFPQHVVATAVALAELHLLTERLDQQMALAWLGRHSSGHWDESARYVACWATVDKETDRQTQLQNVVAVGRELNRLTKITGLRMLLRMMRKPATSAGLGSLQSFLEAGFDTFAEMSSKGDSAQFFLKTIEERESQWIELLFSSDSMTATTALRKAVDLKGP